MISKSSFLRSPYYIKTKNLQKKKRLFFLKNSYTTLHKPPDTHLSSHYQKYLLRCLPTPPLNKTNLIKEDIKISDQTKFNTKKSDQFDFLISELINEFKAFDIIGNIYPLDSLSILPKYVKTAQGMTVCNIPQQTVITYLDPRIMLNYPCCGKLVFYHELINYRLFRAVLENPTYARTDTVAPLLVNSKDKNIIALHEGITFSHEIIYADQQMPVLFEKISVDDNPQLKQEKQFFLEHITFPLILNLNKAKRAINQGVIDPIYLQIINDIITNEANRKAIELYIYTQPKYGLLQLPSLK